MKVHLIKHVKTKDVEFDIDYYVDEPEPMSARDKANVIWFNTIAWGVPLCIGLLDYVSN